MTLRRAAAGAAAGACLVRLALSQGKGLLPGSPELWERRNHAGNVVSLAEGPAVLAGCVVAGLGCPPAGTAAALAGGLGLLDDLAGTTARKGLRGHLVALRHGEVTTGAIKVFGLGLVGLLTAATLDRRVGPSAVVGGGVVAGAANLVNLFDLRPGRAVKVTALMAVPMLRGGDLAEGVLLGTCLGALPEDLAARHMMGDTGANALGALAGGLLVSRTGWRGRSLALAALSALTLASERVSFSQVIAEQPLLRRVDEWGRARA